MDRNMHNFGKRKEERYNLKTPAKITVYDGPNASLEKAIYYLTTRNVCSGGAYFPTEHNFKQGVRVDVDMNLNLTLSPKMGKKHSSVQLSGQIIRVDHGGIAIQFGKHYKILPVVREN